MERNGNIYLRITGPIAEVLYRFLNKYGQEHYRAHADRDKARGLAFRFSNLHKRAKVARVGHAEPFPIAEEELHWLCGVIRTECINHPDAGQLAHAYILFTKDRVAEVWLPAW